MTEDICEDIGAERQIATAGDSRVADELAKIERGAEIALIGEVERPKIIGDPAQSNARAAAGAARSVELQLEACQVLVDAAGNVAIHSGDWRQLLASMETIAKVLSASAAATQMLGRLRDGFARTERHVILEDREDPRDANP